MVFSTAARVLAEGARHPGRRARRKGKAIANLVSMATARRSRRCWPSRPGGGQVRLPPGHPQGHREATPLSAFQNPGRAASSHGRRGRRRGDPVLTTDGTAKSWWDARWMQSGSRNDVRPMGRTAYGVKGSACGGRQRGRHGGGGGRRGRHGPDVCENGTGNGPTWTNTACNLAAEWVLSRSTRPAGTAGWSGWPTCAVRMS